MMKFTNKCILTKNVGYSKFFLGMSIFLSSPQIFALDQLPGTPQFQSESLRNISLETFEKYRSRENHARKLSESEPEAVHFHTESLEAEESEPVTIWYTATSDTQQELDEIDEIKEAIYSVPSSPRILSQTRIGSCSPSTLSAESYEKEGINSVPSSPRILSQTRIESSSQLSLPTESHRKKSPQSIPRKKRSLLENFELMREQLDGLWTFLDTKEKELEIELNKHKKNTSLFKNPFKGYDLRNQLKQLSQRKIIVSNLIKKYSAPLGRVFTPNMDSKGNIFVEKKDSKGNKIYVKVNVKKTQDDLYSSPLKLYAQQRNLIFNDRNFPAPDQLRNSLNATYKEIFSKKIQEKVHSIHVVKKELEAPQTQADKDKNNKDYKTEVKSFKTFLNDLSNFDPSFIPEFKLSLKIEKTELQPKVEKSSLPLSQLEDNLADLEKKLLATGDKLRLAKQRLETAKTEEEKAKKQQEIEMLQALMKQYSGSKTTTKDRITSINRIKIIDTALNLIKETKL